MLRNKHIQPQTKLVIVNVLRYFQRESENQGTLAPFGSVMQRTADACGITVNTLSTIKKRVLEAEKENKPPHFPSNTRKRTKSKSVDVDNFVKDAIKRKIYEMHSKRLHVTVKSLKQELSACEIFDFSTTSLKRLLPTIGFTFKKDDGRRVLFELEHIAAARVKFLREYYSNKEMELYDPVFLDETWVFSRGSTKKSWHDKSMQSIKKKPFGEGKRFIVLHAGNKDGFIPGASLLFSTKSLLADYHGDMNAELFTKWFEESLIANLERPSVIVLDNASYHSKLLEKVPNTSSNKQEMIDYLRKHNIAFEPFMLKRELLALVRQNVKPKIYLIDEIAAKNGHKVIRLPPYHCQFNPIELIWAYSKDYYDKNIGKFNQQYNDDNVRAIWFESLQRIDGAYWQKCIEHAEKCMYEWWNIEQRFELVEPLVFTVRDTSSSTNSGSDSDSYTD